MNLPLIPPAPSALASPSGVSGTTHSSGKLRSACNRCHSQKLRCIRDETQARCERCLRLNVICRFAPRAPRASVRPSQKATRSSQSSTTQERESDLLSTSAFKNADIAHRRGTRNPNLCSPAHGDSAMIQDVSWSVGFSESAGLNLLDENIFSDLHFLPMDENNANHIGSHSYPRIEMLDTTAILDNPPEGYVRQLARLNVALHECATKLPSMPAVAGVSGVDTGISTFSFRKAKLFAIDELFKLTTEFIETLKSISIERRNIDATSNSTDSRELRSQLTLLAPDQQDANTGQVNSTTDMETFSRRLSHLDDATVLMILSCHSRMLETYTSIFHMMEACLKHSLAPSLDHDWTVILPQLQLGSVASPPVYVDINTPLSPAKESMYMLMMTMLSSQLWKQVADLMRAGVVISSNSVPQSQRPVTSAMWGKAEEQTDSLLRLIHATISI